MNRRDFAKIIGVGFASIYLKGCTLFKDGSDYKRPNIVLVLADDLGFSDIGCYGSEIQTPNLDALASKGIQFTHFYNAARCCPSRASLLTGLYPHQADIGWMSVDKGKKGYKGNLSTEAVTIAEVLKNAGYNTFMCGKWHLVDSIFTKDRINNWPCQRGFDRYFGTLGGYTSQWDPMGLIEDNEFVQAQKGFLYTEAMSSKAVEYIKSATVKNKPFFLYLAYTAPHYPLHARQENIDKYDGVYDIGWQQTRKNRFNKMKNLGIIPECTMMEKLDPASIEWSEEKNKKWQAQRMQTYAAMVDEVDQGIGKILKCLESENQFDNTLFIFLSDNGASCEGHLYNKVERSGEPWISPLVPKQTPDGKTVIAGDIPGLHLGGPDTFGSYGLDWASVSNTPFRRHKSWVHEGGIATPCIMHWPNGIKRHFVNSEICHIIDFMPTFIKLAHTDYPLRYNGNSVLPMEGKCLTDIFENKPIEGRPLFWEHEGNRAVVKDGLKLVSEFPGKWRSFYPHQSGQWELYNIETDRGELCNIADRYPDKVRELSELYYNWAFRVGVIDWNEFS